MSDGHNTSPSRTDSLIDAVEHLHACPMVVSRILRMLANPDFEVRALEKELKTDPALAALILKLVNSSRFGLVRKVCSIHQAVARLGMRTLRLAVLGFGLVDRLAKGAPAKLLQDYWRRALTVASVVARLCPTQRSVRPDEAYAAGLFADIGVLVLSQVATERYLGLCERHGHGRELAAAEQREFGASHAELAKRLLDRWDFPERLTHALARHHDEKPNGDLLCRLLMAGDMLADALWTPQTRRMGRVCQFFRSEFQLDPEGLFALALDCNRDILESAEVFRVELHGTIDCDALRRHALLQYQAEAMDSALACDGMLAPPKYDSVADSPVTSRSLPLDDKALPPGNVGSTSRPEEEATLDWEPGRPGKAGQKALAVAESYAAGHIFGKYVVLQKLGQGGMGVVLKARHQCMDRLVAVKMLPPSAMQAPESVQRFYQEVKAAAQLTHPNIVTAYDAGEHEGVHYLVMEYIDGQDLARIVQARGPLSVEDALDYTVQAARGLDYAHQRGIIHRDVKPANLLVDVEGTVKILDMGLARLIEINGQDGGAAISSTGRILGSVDYLSPEQAEDADRVDERADVYSLGCTLHYLLTGRPMYDVDSIVQKLLAHREQPIPSLCAVRPDLPEALDEVFRRMVAKRPEDRWETMAHVMTALQHARDGAPNWRAAERDRRSPSPGRKRSQVTTLARPRNAVSTTPFPLGTASGPAVPPTVPGGTSVISARSLAGQPTIV